MPADGLRRLAKAFGQLASVALAVSIGAAGGSAYAAMTATGFGSGGADAGSPVSISSNAATGPADLYPGATGAVYFTLKSAGRAGARFDEVTSASVVSANVVACPSSNIRIAPALPYTFSPAVTVSAESTSATQSIPALVQLSANAPSGCAGTSFTVTFTLSGTSP